MSLLRYTGRRLLVAVPLLLAAAATTFLLVHLAPGDPVLYLAGESGTPAFYAQVRRELGLDRPLPEQLARYLWHVVRGDLGRSLHQGRPVAALILDRLPATLLLVGTAFALASVLGVALGIWAGLRPDGPVDRALLAATTVGSALPVFWVGLLLVLLFALGTGWFPTQGMTSPRAPQGTLPAAADLLHHLVLPALALAVQPLAAFSRVMRAKLREALAEPYVMTARAKGLPRRRVVAHAARNALLPVITLMGGHASALVTGAVLTETVFAWPGLGRLALDATLTRDYPLIMGLVLFGALGTVAVNLLTDLTYGLVDPRITYG